MIHAVVLHHDRAAIIELPKEPIELEMELAAIGIQENPKRIWIQDEDGRPVRIQLFSQSDRENHAAGLFTAGNTLEEVNQCAHLLQSMHEGIADAVEEKLLRYKYATPQELMDDIRSMTEDLIAVTVDYYCPLKFQMTDEEYGDWYEVDNSYGLANEDAIRERCGPNQDRDLNDMAAIFSRQRICEGKDSFRCLGCGKYRRRAVRRHSYKAHRPFLPKRRTGVDRRADRTGGGRLWRRV